jgi:hypothetical protein
MNDCSVCPVEQKQLCMAVKAKSNPPALIWIPKCEWDKMRELL